MKISLIKVALLFSTVAILVAAIGCGESRSTKVGKSPRPVTVMRFEKQNSNASFAVSGSVKSWKTEQIGFEVSGRIISVLEPGENVNGQITDPQRRNIFSGTPLAMIDPARYETEVNSARAALEVAKLEKEGIEIRLGDLLPEDVKSAKADLKLAESDLKRMEGLKQQRAISQAEYDQAVNQFNTAKARLASVELSEKQTNAELRASNQKIDQAQQALNDAIRDRKNTILYAPYSGQISDVDVVLGSVVTSGTPVLTLQMMNPIKVEVELSVEQSRKMRRKRQVPITFADPATGKKIAVPAMAEQASPGEVNPIKVPKNGFVYMIDPSADPTTKTFTMTLLILNQKFRAPLPQGYDTSTVARTDDIWPLEIKELIVSSPEDLSAKYLSQLKTAKETQAKNGQANVDANSPLADGVQEKQLRELLALSLTSGYMVEENAIFQEGDEFFVWIVEDFLLGETMDEVVSVRKEKVTKTQLRIPFLGNWIFQHVMFENGEALNSKSLVAGKLVLPPQADAKWDGKSVFVDSGEQWMLRPGDTVNVNLSSDDGKKGFYVPVDAIQELSGSTYIFALAENSDTVQRIQVNANLPDNLDRGSMVSITPYRNESAAEDSSSELSELASIDRIVVGGVQFLVDGEKVNVVKVLNGQQ